MTKIFFNSRSAFYSEFSNFSKWLFEVDDVEYSTIEHYFQAQKFKETDPDWFEQVAHAKTAAHAKRFGASREHPIDPLWEQKKLMIMRIGIEAKFRQNPFLIRLLMETDDKPLVHDAPWGDDYWGVDKRGYGKNMQGEILMVLRETFRQEYRKGKL